MKPTAKQFPKLFSALLLLCLLAACGGAGGSSVSISVPSTASPPVPPSSTVQSGTSSEVNTSMQGGSSTDTSTSVSEEIPVSELSYEEYFSEEREFWLYHRPQDSPYDWDTLTRTYCAQECGAYRQGAR